MSHRTDPDHPILPDAWKYEVVEFHWSRLGEEPFVELVLRHAENAAVRRLRFRRPEEVRFANVGMSWGLYIQDIRSRQIQGINVKVGNFENNATQVELLAWDVVDVTDGSSPA